MTALLEQFTAYVRSLSSREQRLAGSVILLALIFLVFTTVRSSYQYLERLDSTISHLQDQLLNYNGQLLRKQSVESRYAMVAAQHSSAWSAEEIRDRLRSEIYRLAQKVPPPLDEHGIPVTVTSSSGLLVEIPELGEGRLFESTEGYREYAISFRLPSVEIDDLVAFLARLQGSPQSLRIDGLEVNRGPTGTLVAAAIDLTRTVVDGGDFDSLNVPLPPDEEMPVVAAQPVELKAEEWTCVGGVMRVDGDSLIVDAVAATAELYFARTLKTAGSYDLFLELESSGPGMLAVSANPDGVIFPGSSRFEEDGPHRYHVRFTVPEGDTETREMRVPSLFVNGVGSRLRVRGVVLKPGETG